MSRNSAELPSPGTLLFDLDGTLVDSLPDLTAALNAVTAAAGLPPVAAAVARDYVGDGAKVMIERAFAAAGRPLPPDALALFQARYEALLPGTTRPFPGVATGLARLAEAGWRLAVCTNKTLHHTLLILRGLGLLPFFGQVSGGDSFPFRKPDGRHLLATLEALGAPRAGAVMIGDSRNDVLAARDAGLPVIAVRWGYAAAESLGADRVAGSMEELLAQLTSPA